MAKGEHHRVRSTHLCAVLAFAGVLTLAACSDATGPAAAPSPDIQSLLDARREAYGAPGGLALLARGDSRWFARSGTADTAGTPITEATRFRIASITKPIVAALVLDAVDRGEVALDDVVGDLLPGTVREDPPITVRQLLDHTSGVFDVTNAEASVESLQADIARLPDQQIRAEAQAAMDGFVAGQQVIAPAPVIVALAELHDRYFPPGSGYHYSNTGYQLAGMVLEEATGAPLPDLLDERIVEPLGLQRTTLAPPDTGSPELRGYGTSTEDGSLVDVTEDLLAFGNGANGGIISTAGELLATIRAIVGGQLLPEDLTAQMKEPNRESYGLGLVTYTLSCGTFHGHEGGVNGTASIAMVSPDATDGVVIALNLRSGEDPRLSALADQMLCGSP
jgi:D-alanyl-D-alanine carboxypeptidase